MVADPGGPRPRGRRRGIDVDAANKAYFGAVKPSFQPGERAIVPVWALSDVSWKAVLLGLAVGFLLGDDLGLTARLQNPVWVFITNRRVLIVEAVGNPEPRNVMIEAPRAQVRIDRFNLWPRRVGLYFDVCLTIEGWGTVELKIPSNWGPEARVLRTEIDQA